MPAMSPVESPLSSKREGKLQKIIREWLAGLKIVRGIQEVSIWK
jgi:hypothetical protein